MHTITPTRAAMWIKEIEGIYQALWVRANLPESIRRGIKDNAAQAHETAQMILTYERKTREFYG